MPLIAFLAFALELVHFFLASLSVGPSIGVLLVGGSSSATVRLYIPNNTSAAYFDPGGVISSTLVDAANMLGFAIKLVLGKGA